MTPIQGIDGGTEIKVSGGIPKPIYQKLPPIHNGHGKIYCFINTVSIKYTSYSYIPIVYKK